MEIVYIVYDSICSLCLREENKEEKIGQRRKMSSFGKSNQLEADNRANNRFVAILTRTLSHSEKYNDVVVLAITLIMIATVSVLIRRLKRLKHVTCSALSKKLGKTPNSSIADNRIDKISINEKFVALNESARISDEILSELHAAADKCYIKKYAKRCVELVNYCPLLVNARFGSTGLTPFHRVCFHGHASLMQFMLSRGADPHLTSGLNENAICLVVFYYLNKQGNVDDRDLACLDILRRAGCRLEGNSVWYEMLLKNAVRSRKRALIEWLFANRKMPKSNGLKRFNSHPPTTQLSKSSINRF